MKKLPNHHRQTRYAKANGFSLIETLVALSAGSLIITGGALALRTTGTLINQSADKTVLRQNTTNGMRLLRSEVERSLHIIINNRDNTDIEERFKLSTVTYQDSMSNCQALAGQKNVVFSPLFGIKMAEINSPVIYGFGISPTSQGYDLMRCGTALDIDGKYIEKETSTDFLSVVIDHIGVMGCARDDDNKTIDPSCELDVTDENSPYKASLSKILTKMGTIEFTAKTNLPFRTPIPTLRQPALRVETDSSFKLVKFIDPNPNDPNFEFSYLQSKNNDRVITTQPLYLSAFARADKRLGGYGDDNGLQNITIFKDITSKYVRFVLDGSGSMSACILWGDTQTGKQRKYYNPNSGGYITTDKHCHITRMETLQQELRTMIAGLPDYTNISLEMFSAPGGRNHDEIWSLSKDGLVRLGGNGVRESALQWVNTLDDVSNVGKWGGTIPWPGLSRAFNDNDADTVYFLSDGQPNSFSDQSLGNNVNNKSKVVDYYLSENDKRSRNNKSTLKVNSIALGIESDWMEDLSEKTGGNYMQYDRDTLSETANDV